MATKVLYKVVGEDGCENDVIVKIPPISNKIEDHVIFFPGDVQDYSSLMSNHRDHYRWQEYSLEKTSSYISAAYPKSCIWIIRATKLHLNTFACYKNFIECNNFGMAQYSLVGTKALKQLINLLQNAMKNVFSKDEFESYQYLPLHIIGFSKGCSVLNQLLYELPDYKSEHDDEIKDFIPSIKSMTWLDSGNNTSEAYTINENCLSFVANKIPCINVHVTPYQMCDVNRKWIKEEKEMFVDILKTHNANINVYTHFKGESPCIEQHFSLLKNFNNPISSGAR